MQRKSNSPVPARQNLSDLQIYKIVFEYGPTQLNLFRYVTKKANILWQKAQEKCILKDDGKPLDGFLLIHRDDDGNVTDCLKTYGFDVYQQEKLFEAESILNDQRERVCMLYLGEEYLKTMNTARIQNIRENIRIASTSNVFIMTASDDERNEVIECCKRFKLCPNSHVISPTSDRTSLYEAFYNVLEKNLQTFLSDLETQTSTRQSHATKGELNSLIEKVKSRNASVKSPLTKRCLELIEASSKHGVVGYRLFGNELHIYENEHLRTGTKERSEIENSIKENFNGKVHFRSLNNVLIPHCTVKCGDYLKNGTLKRMGTVGIFGEIKNADENDSNQTVAISSPHVISSGEIACTATGGKFGECIWPENGSNIHDVSIIQIDFSSIATLQRTIFNKNIVIENIPKEDLLYREVFKFGASSQKTCGLIEQIDHFRLFGSDVMTISTDDPERPFSTNGDSGAIVLTILNGKHHGIGVIYGGSLEHREAKIDTSRNESIAIFLKNALDRFTRARHMSIEFDKI